MNEKFHLESFLILPTKLRSLSRIDIGFKFKKKKTSPLFEYRSGLSFIITCDGDILPAKVGPDIRIFHKRHLVDP